MSTELDLSRVRRILWRYLPLIMLLAFDLGLAAHVYENSKTAAYASTAQVRVGESEVAELRGLTVNLVNDDAALSTVALDLSSADLRRDLRNNLGIADGEHLVLETEIIEETAALVIRAEARSPELAQEAVSEAMRLYSLGESRAESERLQAVIDGLEKQVVLQQDRLVELDAEAVRLVESLEATQQFTITNEAGTIDVRLSAINEFRLLTAKRIVELEQQSQDIQAAQDQLDLDYLRVISSPSFKDTPVSPRPRRAAMLGFVGGLVLATLGALTVAGYRDRIMTDGEILEETDGLPVLSAGTGGSVIARSAETARSTAGWITSLDPADRPRSLLWCEVGKVESAALLFDVATAIEGEGLSVTLVDLDQRHDGLTEFLGIETSGSLQDVLRGERSPLDAADLVGVQAGAIHVLSMDKHSRTRNLVTRDRLVRLEAQLAESTDLTIFSTNGPDVADTRLAASASEAALMVTRNGTSRRKDLRQGRLALEQAGTRVVGVVTVPTPRGMLSRFRKGRRPHVAEVSTTS